jgi:hypothetical protein
MMKTRNSLWIVLCGVVWVGLASDLSLAQSHGGKVAKAASEIPIIESAALYPNLSVPWSRPVQVVDPFEGKFLAVFDRHYLGGKYGGDRKVISAWSKDTVRILLNVRQDRCDGFYSLRSHFALGSSCVGIDSSRTVRTVLMKVGGQVLTLNGENGKFAVNDAIAINLKTAPEEEITLRLVLEGGESIDSKIGEKTVKAWRSIY